MYCSCRMKEVFQILFMSLGLSLFAQQVNVNELMSRNDDVIADEDGDFSDWIEIYNKSQTSINLLGYKLSDNAEIPEKWTFPDIEIKPDSFLLVFASGKNRTFPVLHTNFKISSEGEPILLSNPNNELVDSVEALYLEPNQSYGRYEDGTDPWLVMNVPSPGASNIKQVIQKEIIFSKEPGFYVQPFYLHLFCDDSIYYTLDGTEPSLTSRLCNDSIFIYGTAENNLSLIPTNPEYFPDNYYLTKEFGWKTPAENISNAVVLKTRAFRSGTASSPVYTQTYFTEGKTFSLPVVSIVMDSLNLFDFTNGIYIPGVHLDEKDLVWTGNYFETGNEWERPAFMEYFDKEGTLQLSENLGVRIHGQKSRLAPQKSLRLYARSEYGTSEFNFPFFEERSFSKYKRLVLRSSYTYWWQRNTLFQDDFIHSFISSNVPVLDVQMSSPSLVFLNGEYWGVQNLRERQDKYYLEALHDVNRDSVDIIEGNFFVEEGDANDYLQLLEFISSHDFSNCESYFQLKEFIDIENYMDYLIMEMYFGNMDWPENNLSLWKAKEPGAKWRWLIYDLDATMNDYMHNPFQWVYEKNMPSLFFREILECSMFRDEFVARFTYHLNNTFIPENMNSLVNEFRNKYQPEINEHIDRWGNPVSASSWSESIDYLSEFIINRPCYLQYQLIDFFDLKEIDFTCSEGNDDIALKLFPNPCSDFLRVIINGGKVVEGSISIVNVSGQTVVEKQITSNLEVINTSFLKNGMYFLTIKNKDIVMAGKFVVQK